MTVLQPQREWQKQQSKSNLSIASSNNDENRDSDQRPWKLQFHFKVVDGDERKVRRRGHAETAKLDLNSSIVFPTLDEFVDHVTNPTFDALDWADDQVCTSASGNEDIVRTTSSSTKRSRFVSRVGKVFNRRQSKRAPSMVEIMAESMAESVTESILML
mmetsp:Transcript_14071/g.30564  ORF Transcript_14071/g.30564 Transcript_14071/m.30564 type:complete len:159 (-) Transcript_14071:38-514(-)|eukprot:CAMPEP_0178473636 /NCGR_PEP_ID=MMETSP0696-20121128/2190_1 /TAXON_ID=265572 /ORGANISM="Extubocellulus spinifer, Strain CCMP396" /LENGTH=158 /DNA_ID=CAMNT_0020100867 /DNA_START=316 /DNA_END=792 /DNA_ORIENTATION=-